MSRVLVVGAGLSGLSAACHLVGRGHQVRVVERAATPGGRCERVVRDGFTFDTGATVMTMPNLLDDALRAVGASVDELVPMTRLDPGYRSVFADGSVIYTRAGFEALREEIRRTCGDHDADRLGNFVDWLRKLHDVEMPHFIDRNYDSWLGLVSRPGPALEILRLGGTRRLGNAIASYFDDDRLHRMFTFQALYAGMSPQEALAIYAVITHMDSIEGVFHPRGGMGAVAEALASAASAAGVRFDYNCEVTAIGRSPNGRVSGVYTADGEVIAADAVVCTLDLPVAYRRLLPDLRPPRALVTGKYSPSAVVWHLGVRGVLPAEVEHHNIYFGREWAGSFTSLTRDLELMADPSRLVSVPTRSEPGLAPDGQHVLYVLEPVPNNRARIDWDARTPGMRQRLLEFLASHGYPTDIQTELFYTPYDWQRAGMAWGTPFALSHILRQTGPFRPNNVDRRIPGLVFAGSGTVPGVGVPMVLVSGKLAADRVDELEVS